MGVEKIRRQLAVAGAITANGGGTIPAGDTLTISGALNAQGATSLRIPTVDAALGTSNMATASAGILIAGFSGGSPQLGVVINGSAFVLEGTVSGNAIWRNKT